MSEREKPPIEDYLPPLPSPTEFDRMTLEQRINAMRLYEGFVVAADADEHQRVEGIAHELGTSIDVVRRTLYVLWPLREPLIDEQRDLRAAEATVLQRTVDVYRTLYSHVIARGKKGAADKAATSAKVARVEAEVEAESPGMKATARLFDVADRSGKSPRTVERHRQRRSHGEIGRHV